MMDAEFGCIEPFGIDKGELDGLSPQEVFVLGYELADISRLAERPEAINRAVHCENKDRLERALNKRGRRFSLTWMMGDISESWMQLEVIAQEQKS